MIIPWRRLISTHTALSLSAHAPALDGGARSLQGDISPSARAHPHASLSWQEGNLKLGTWQMVLWQPRWDYAQTDGLYYQKITADERPIGKEKCISFADVREIEQLEYGNHIRAA